VSGGETQESRSLIASKEAAVTTFANPRLVLEAAPPLKGTLGRGQESAPGHLAASPSTWSRDRSDGCGPRAMKKGTQLSGQAQTPVLLKGIPDILGAALEHQRGCAMSSMRAPSFYTKKDT